MTSSEYFYFLLEYCWVTVKLLSTFPQTSVRSWNKNQLKVSVHSTDRNDLLSVIYTFKTLRDKVKKQISSQNKMNLSSPEHCLLCEVFLHVRQKFSSDILSFCTEVLHHFHFFLTWYLYIYSSTLNNSDGIKVKWTGSVLHLLRWELVCLCHQ